MVIILVISIQVYMKIKILSASRALPIANVMALDALHAFFKDINI